MMANQASKLQCPEFIYLRFRIHFFDGLQKRKKNEEEED